MNRKKRLLTPFGKKENQKMSMKKYRLNNKEKIKERLKEWKKKNPNYQKEWYRKNDGEYSRQYYLKNKKHLNELARIRNKERKLKKRFTIFERDNFTCQYCGRKSLDVILEVDHIIPKSKGGLNEISNYKTACKECNNGKGDRILKEFKR